MKQAAAISWSELVQDALNRSPHAITVLNAERQVVFCSRGFLRIAGKREPGKAVGQRLGEILNCVHAFEEEGGCGTSQFCGVCGALRSILAAQHGWPDARECRVTRRFNGMLQALELLVSCSPADVGEGFLYSYIVDISHEKRRRELEHVFLHDVLNSASAVESLAYLLEDMAPSAEAAESVGILKRTSSQLLSQIEGQRQLTEAEDGNLKVHFSSFGSLDLVREIVSDFQFLPVARDRLLVIAPGSPDVRMVSDPVLVRRVLENLVRNALEASEPSETVTVGCSERNGVAEFHVHNRAVMSQEVQLQVFQRSFSTKGDARGLGTYGVRLLTERYLKGGVGFESVAPHGTTFTVTCPIAPRAGPTGRAAPARR